MTTIKRLFTGIFLLFFFAATSHASSDLIELFASGDVAKIERMLNSSVDLKLMNSERTCSKMQTSDALNDFFRKHRPSNFTMSHKTETGRSGLFIGKLYTSNGTYKVTVLTKKNADINLIHQIRIEEAQ